MFHDQLKGAHREIATYVAEETTQHTDILIDYVTGMQTHPDITFLSV
jgi:hypothetical protein